MSFLQLMRAHFGALRVWDKIMLFSMRLDETGTDGKSAFVTVGGAVSSVPEWDLLEIAWKAKMRARGIPFFHLVDFDGRKGLYSGWSDKKRQLFENSLRGLIRRHTRFSSAVSIHSATHANVKKRMRGITGFQPSSDYGLGLRFLLHHASEVLEKLDPDFSLDVIVEHGPWTSGALGVFNRVRTPPKKTKPTKHAHRLGVFSSFPKGEIASLDAADLIAGREHERLLNGRAPDERDEALAHVLSESELERFYQMMIDEKEARRAHYGRDASLSAKASHSV